MLSWHKSKDAKSVHKNWNTLATPDFDGEWYSEYIEKVIKSQVWSPIKWCEGIRKESHFIGSLLCALDFDSPETPLPWAFETFADFDVIIGTTKSHQKEKNGITCDRYRVVMWFAEPIMSLELYKHNMKLLIEKYGADKACKDGARFFFPCTEIVASHAGHAVDVAPLPVVLEKKVTRYGLAAMPRGDINIPNTGERNTTCFKQACKMFDQRIDHAMILDTLRRMSNGMNEKEILSIFNSAKRKTGN